MPLSLFDHRTLGHFCEVEGTTDRFGHSFGGKPSAFGIRFINLEQPLHLLYRLNLADAAVAVDLPGLTWLPLCYGFSYATYGGTMIYRVVSNTEIELITPDAPQYDPHFPYRDYPKSFRQSAVSFARQPYDPTAAEDALSLAGIFGVDRLSTVEMARAVAIVEKEGLIAQWRKSETFSDWTPEDMIRSIYEEPFIQGAPSKSCDNPHCTAEIAYRMEDMEINFPTEFEELIGSKTLKVEAHDVRRDSMRVFAIFEPDKDDAQVWYDPDVQLIFEICEVCHCIRVSNQCT